MQYLMSVGCSPGFVSSKSSSDSELSSPSLLATSIGLSIVSGLIEIDASSEKQRFELLQIYSKFLIPSY